MEDTYIMMKYKIDIFAALKARGYSQSQLLKNKTLSSRTAALIRSGEMVTPEIINRICLLLRCQPGDILEVIPTDEEKIKYF